MPISHKHKVILVHIPKNAGTSMEIALDIIGEHTRPQKESEYNDILWSPDGLQHLTASEIKKRVTSEVWDTYRKVAFLKCPYERLESEYLWRKRTNKPYKDLTFSDFVLQRCKVWREDELRHLWPQTEFIDTNDIECYLLGDWCKVFPDIPLGHYNKTTEDTKFKWSDGMVNLVQKVYEKDFLMIELLMIELLRTKKEVV